MLLSLPLALLCLTHGVQSAAVASTTVTSFSPDTKLVTNDVALQNWTKVEVGHPSSVGSEVAAVAAPTPKTSVVMAVIASNTALAAATCTAGIIWLCATSVIATILSNFFLLFVPSSGPTDASNVKRADLPTITHFVHEAWLPTESCSTFCQLKAGSAHGDWTHFTNTTVDGVVHDVHFRQNGNLMGLRAVRQSSTANKRDDNSDDDGVVAAYFWEDNNQQAFNDWDRSRTSGIGQTVTNYMQGNQGQIVCADLLDQDGAVNTGIVTLDNGNDELGLTDSQYSSWLDYCLKGDPNTP